MAEQSRQGYIDGLQDSLLRPLRDRLAADVQGLFPEIDGIHLAPEVSSIERTLSNVGVTIDDIVSTPLAGKGTGVRGGLLVAMLSYLALNASRGMVFALEEPEAFLHPAAQESLREQLELLAAVPGVTLLVTSHSPFIVTRSSAGRVVSLGKDQEGRTRLVAAAPGNADHAPLIGGLLREAALESLLAGATALPEGTKAVVLVEGEGDRFCLDLAARLVGRPELLEGVVIRPTGGTIAMIAQAVIAKAATDLPVVVLVDNDEPGRHARTTLVGQTFGFKKPQVLTYAAVFPQKWEQFPVEAEDLFAPELLERFVVAHGQSVVEGTKKRPDGAFHYDLGQVAKESLLTGWLAAETTPADVARWVDMLLLIRSATGLANPLDTVDEMVDQASAGRPQDNADRADGRVLVAVGQHDYARYLDDGALVLPTEYQLPDGVTHVAFYHRAIQPHVAAIVADQPNLMFATTTSQQLRATNKGADEALARIIDSATRSDSTLVDRSHRVLLLSGPEDPETLVLDSPVRNTKSLKGKPVAWTLGPKVVPLRSLAMSPATTDELDNAVHALGEQP